MKQKKVIVLIGGYSPESEVSLVSGNEIHKALTEIGYNSLKLNPVDFSSYSDLIIKIKEHKPYIVFNALHGEDGENGRIQALLDLENIPYTGSGFRTSSICMDKIFTSRLVDSLNIPIPKHLYLESKDELEIEAIMSEFSLPIVIKPNDAGSSVGIKIVNAQEDIKGAVSEASKFSSRVIIEEYIEGRELTVTVLNKKALPVVEIQPNDGWYDYTNKYTKGNTVYKAPADLTFAENYLIQTYSESIYKLLDCKAYARIDFRYDGQNFYFLEVNTLPGMTPLSLSPMAAKEEGLCFPEFLKKIIEFSIVN